MNKFTLWTILAICLIIMTILNAQAQEVEIAGGITQFGKTDNGTWYQEGFDHTIKVTSPSLSIGVKTDYLRAGYTYLGHASSSALAVSVDSNYNEHTANHCNGECLPLAHWNGHGDVSGLYVSAYYKYLELGVFAYRPTWHMDVPDIVWCQGCQPKSVTVIHEAKIQTSPYVSFGYEHIWASMYIHINANGDLYPAIYKGKTFKLEYRYTFN